MSGYTIIAQILMPLKAIMEVYGKTVTGLGPLMAHRNCGVFLQFSHTSRRACDRTVENRRELFPFPPPSCVRLFAFNHLSKSVLFVGHRQTV